VATKPSPSKLADSYQTYPTADAAAVAALRGISNTKTETGGGILYNKDLNVYAATTPVGQNNGAHFEAAVGVPKGWQLDSTFHTYPSGDRSTQFSDNDISTAQQLKAPSYVLARDDNKIRIFDPASSPVSRDTRGSLTAGARFALGDVVDETPPAPASTPPTQLAASTPAPTPAPTPPAPSAPPLMASITGSRITMKDFAAKHRVTRYRHKIVRIK
jgi:hypothetical protein